ncbi:MAG: metal-dependent hydrolase [Anaerolineae bacterium]|nr:metal-dependent hydrolase [Anaerolineae bacterium]
MKGISHFMTGVALATFFPEVVQQAEIGSLLPMLGGIGGILPDTLDFKFARYFEKYDLEIDPGLEPDPGAIADALVWAMHIAYEEARPQDVMAHTIRLGADLWREYAIRFDPETGEIVVRIGPLVNTGLVPYAGTAPVDGEEARRKVDVPLVHTYSAEYKVNIFSGPSFRFAREEEHLCVYFLDWHRRWSHSLLLGLAVGAVLGLILGLLGGWATAKWAALVSALGFIGHIVEDQCGYMGSNLLWPLTQKRIPGLGAIHSGDAIPNFLTVWTSLAIILLNLDRFSAQPRLPQARYLFWSLCVPWCVLGGYYVWGSLRVYWQNWSKALLQQTERVAEAEEVDLV